MRFVAFMLLAACGSPSLQYYTDTDKPIGNGGADGGACTATAFTVTPVTPLIQLMVDGSGTMGDNIGDGNGKYQAVQKALYSGSTALLTKLQSKAQFGASVYLGGGGTCPTFHAAPCALSNMAAVKNAIDMGPINGTDPLTEALLSLHDSFGNVTGGPKVIVLATDGTPNACGNNGVDHTTQAVAQAAANLADKDIKLYVMGLGNVSTTFLQKIANAGVGSTTNVPYYTASSEAQVQTNYQTIFDAVMDCSLTLDGTIDPNQASLGIVKSNGTTLAFTTDWTVIDTHTIKLVGQACTDYKASMTSPEITATFTCGATRP